MLRGIVVAIGLLGSADAYADSKADVEALIQKNLDAIRTNNWKAFDATFRSDGYYALPSSSEKLVDHFYSTHTVNLRQKLERMTVVVDDAKKLAWFHVDFSGKYQIALHDPGDPKERWFDRRTRMIGIAFDEGGWKLATAAYTTAFADKFLYKDVRELDKPDKITFKGERTSAEYAARWFTKGLLPDMAPGTVAVSGTAEGEWAVGTSAPKLVAAWDKLGLWPIKIVGRKWKSYPIALVLADVALPVKVGQGGAKEAGVTRLRLHAIVIPDGAGWKWTALSFGDGFDLEWVVDRPNWKPPRTP